MRKSLLAMVALIFLAGCATQERIVVQRVNVPIPIACQEPMPSRPVMPTEALQSGVTLDTFSKAAIAEIERREGYELRLVAALENCRKPVSH